MTFDEILEQVIALLKRQERVSYSALRRRFEIDEAYLNDLKDELLFAYPVTDENDRGLVWNAATEGASESDQTPYPDTQETQPTPVESPLAEPHTPDAAERRQLTILFTDLVDSTQLSGQIDAEEYREIVRAYQAACAEVIERFDCHLAQTLGDGLLIYSGYPVAHENDAERAVRVGLGILDAMKTLNERLKREKGIQLAVRVGVHTGTVVVGDVGAGTRQEQLALGEVPNVAARIQGLAEPDTMVISEATHRLVEGYFDCGPLGARDLRGVAEPMPVYQVLSESGAQSRLDIARGHGLTPLVGREQESGLLLERWEQVKDSQGQVILLSGEAGIGKSRLVEVLKEHVADEPHTRLECRSSPYYQNTALYPITDLLQRTVRWHPDDTPDARLAKLERELSQYRPPLEETVPLFAALLSLSIPENRYPLLNLTPQRQRQKTLESIVSILLEQGEHQPVLFILEDLHWLDPTSLELLDFLMDQTPTASLLTLLTCRPEFQPTWGSRSYLTQVTLNRLARNQVEQIATQVAGGKTLPAEVIDQLEKTDGVPLFVEEMTKAILESGHLKEINGHYELTGTSVSLAIPSTLQDSLMARLDRLVTAKAVAQYAAVIGRRFSYQLLQAVSQLDEATLQRELGRLVEAELVYQRGLPPQATYIFKHALIQDTAYESLLRSTRQGYHRRIAEVLEERFPETVGIQPELLAHHYTEAGLNEQAVGYWHQAGQNAVQRSAYVESSYHLKKGLEVLKTQSETPESLQHELTLQVALGRSLMIARGYGNPEVGTAYDRARELCQQMGDHQQLFSVLRGLVTFHYIRAAYQTARELGEQCLAIAQQMKEPGRLIRAYVSLGLVLLHMGEYELARSYLEQSVTLAHAQPPNSGVMRAVQDVRVTCLLLFSQALWFLGYADQAEQWIGQARSLAHEQSHPFSLAEAINYSGVHHCLRREPQVTQTYAERAIALSIDHGFPHYLSHSTIYKGWALAIQGQPSEGISQIREGLESWRATGGELGRTLFLALLTEAYRLEGYIEEGLATLDEALTFADQHDERLYEAELHRLKGDLLLAQSPDNQTQAESFLHQAINVARSRQAKSLELRAATSLSKLWQNQGKRDEAHELLGDVYGWFTEGFNTADLIEAKALLDELA